VKVDSIPDVGDALIHATYPDTTGTGSSGQSTFMFYDGFESTWNKYPAIGAYSTVMVADQDWETSAPHTMSVVEMNRDPGTGTVYKYWGYYSLQSTASAIGVAFSNNGITWIKYASNPILGNPTEVGNRWRWATSKIIGSYVYLIATEETTPNQVSLYRSAITDGLTFEFVEDIITGNAGSGSFLFLDPVSNNYHLYYRGMTTPETIKVRVATSITNLDSATPITVLTSQSTDPLMPETPNLAAPAMLYVGGTYYLTLEELRTNWTTESYTSTSPTSGFTYQGIIAGGFTEGVNRACWFPQQVGSDTVAYLCHQAAGDWDIERVVIDTTTPTTHDFQGMWQTDVGNADRSSTYAKSGSYSMKLLNDAEQLGGPQASTIRYDHASLTHGSYRWDFAVRHIDTTGDNFRTLIKNSTSGTAGYGPLIKHEGTKVYQWESGAYHEMVGLTVGNSAFHNISFGTTGNTTGYYEVDGTGAATGSYSNIDAAKKLYLSTTGGFDTAYIDDVRLRKLASPEPVVSNESTFYFVNPSTGNDANSGLVYPLPWATIKTSAVNWTVGDTYYWKTQPITQAEIVGKAFAVGN
jgi:hypothetical protein